MSKQPVIIVTGASSGIGAAVAKLFASEGYRVSMGARRIERLQALSTEIKSAGGESIAVQADLTRFEDIQRLVNSTLDGFGQIDILVNNAGFGRIKWLEELDPIKDIQAQIQINLISAVIISHQVLPYLIEQRSGHIINIGSMGGLVASPTYTVYSASKFGLRGFTESLRREVGIYGVHVSGIYPGAVKTEFKQHAGINRKTGRTTPKALLLESEEVAQAVLKVVRRPRRSLIIPWQMRFTVWLNMLFPGIVDRIIERNFTRLERDI
ncbi:MAG: SDR family oxidoreductase [Chloroflexota bacterium]|nr:MAG: SDR family oxidoreductase [Chloroflexota bacterium]UCF28294.1 MAG: SDR family oxidoreductase [Chloroflexota bacterium]